MAKEDENKKELWCAVLGVGAVFSVKIDTKASVEDLQKLLQEEHPLLFPCDHTLLRLFLTKNKEASGELKLLWSNEEDAKALKRGEVTSRIQKIISEVERMDVQSNLNEEENFGKAFQPEKKEIHILAQIPSVPTLTTTTAPAPAAFAPILPTHPQVNFFSYENEVVGSAARGAAVALEERGVAKKRHILNLLKFEGPSAEEAKVFDLATAKAAQWINTTAINKVSSDFPTEYFIRKEPIDVFKLLQTKETMQMALVGSPGVGKSTLAVLYSFWVAFQGNKTVVLLRDIKGPSGGMFVYLLDGKNSKRTIRKCEVAVLMNAVEIITQYQDYELILDGLDKKAIDHYRGILRKYSVLATSAQFQTKSDEAPVLKRCLVPFWAFSDLKRIGIRKNWNARTMEKIYHYAGGSLRFFLLKEDGAKKTMDNAFSYVSIRNAELLQTQYGATTNGQVDRIRMITVRTDDLTNYSDSSTLRQISIGHPPDFRVLDQL
jgi:hypothetical protein